MFGFGLRIRERIRRAATRMKHRDRRCAKRAARMPFAIAISVGAAVHIRLMLGERTARRGWLEADFDASSRLWLTGTMRAAWTRCSTRRLPWPAIW